MTGGSWVANGTFGFLWKPNDSNAVIAVSRLASFGGRAVLVVEARSENWDFTHPGLEVYVSPAGRSIRVWDKRTGKELT